jgi:uncharacterized membrane protein YecN with MAPEG domain
MRVSALYGGLLAVLLLVLSYRVILHRRRHRIDLGDGGDPLLGRLVRGQANFAEYAPFGLLLLVLLELGAWPSWLLHGLGGTLTLGRLAHAWSFSVAGLRLPSRTAGMVLTTAMIAIAAGLCLLQSLGLAG